MQSSNMVEKTALIASTAVLFSSALLAQAQMQAGAFDYKVPGSSAENGLPNQIHLCIAQNPKEGKTCDTWTLSGDHYTPAHLQNPPVLLVMQKLTRENVVFRLVRPGVPNMQSTIAAMVGQLSADSNRTTSGLSMTPGGTVGSFEASWGAALDKGANTPANPEPVSADYAASAFSPFATVPIPQVMHFCASHCLTFTLERYGKLHNYTNLAGQFNEHRVLAIEEFTFKSVVIRRTDTGSNPGGGLMHGQMQFGDSNAVSNEGWSLSWGEALNVLPGSDDERSMRANGSSGKQQISSTPEDNVAMLGLLFAMFGSLSDSSSGHEDTPAVGCAPGYVNMGTYCR